MDLDLADRTAFVPASSSGLGRAAAARLAAEGANVAIASRNEDRISAAHEWIVDEVGVSEERVLALTCDVMNRGDVEAAIQETVSTFGGLDIQVNNHGGPPATTFAEADDDEWDAAYRGVIKSNVWLARSGLPHLSAGDGGSLVVITSASVRESPENQALSNVFRLGLYGLTKTIAREYAPTVRANCVTPRFVMTDRIRYKIEREAEYRGISFEETLASRVDEVLLDRPGEPSEFADAIAFLASPRASYTTGDVLRVDGGWVRGVF